MNVQPILTTHDITKSFGDIEVIRGVNLAVYPGEAFGLLGANGAGKTTIIGMILGLLLPTTGKISMFGEMLNGSSKHFNRRIGAALETSAFYPYLSGRDNLHVFAKALGGVPAARIEKLIDFVGLGAQAGSRFQTYSTGMKRRLTLACSLITDPDLIFLDEPTIGLDPAGMREVRELIGELISKGKTIFITSHMLHEVEQVCRRVAVLNKGEILAQGLVDELVCQDQTLRIEVADLHSAANYLAGLPDVGQVTKKENYLLIDATLDQAEMISSHLAKIGIYPRRIEPVGSDLEDFFLDLTKDEITKHIQ
ncbi:MAG: ABC transporter ATP-binding protein [Anaerolineales bacterium]|nr:ABC transporter ATP-binding protein [Anaerolineales bacterium]